MAGLVARAQRQGFQIRRALRAFDRSGAIRASSTFGAPSRAVSKFRKSAAGAKTGARCPRSPDPLLRQFVRDDTQLMNFRCFGEHVACLDFLHQRGGNLSVEMGVASSLVIKGIEYRERGRSFLNRVPGDGPRLGAHQRNRRSQEVGDLFFLAGAWLQAATYSANFVSQLSSLIIANIYPPPIYRVSIRGVVVQYPDTLFALPLR